MGGVLSVACQGFLVREACVGVLVGGAGFLLSILKVLEQWPLWEIIRLGLLVAEVGY